MGGVNGRSVSASGRLIRVGGGSTPDDCARARVASTWTAGAAASSYAAADGTVSDAAADGTVSDAAADGFVLKSSLNCPVGITG